MKLSRKWLNEYVDLNLSEYDDRSFAEAMTVSGSKVEVTEDLSKKINNVKVGRIVSLEKHPNSDHMLVCQIDIGTGETVQICTGAWNVHVGDLVPAALHKSLLPNGAEITRGKLRGVESDGMLCSLKELIRSHDELNNKICRCGLCRYSISGVYRIVLIKTNCYICSCSCALTICKDTNSLILENTDDL